MNDEFSQTMTPFDQYVSSGSLQVMKLLIPFLPPKSQRMMAVYVKFSEFQYTLASFRTMHQKANSPEDILDGIKPYLSPSDLDSMEQMMSMMNMMQMMQEMQNMPDANVDPLSMMTGMFAQEEQTQSREEGENNDGLDQ